MGRRQKELSKVKAQIDELENVHGGPNKSKRFWVFFFRGFW